MKKTMTMLCMLAFFIIIILPPGLSAEEKSRTPDLYYIQYDLWSGLYVKQDGNDRKYFFQSKEFDGIFLNNESSKELIKQSYFNRSVGTTLLISAVLVPIAEIILFGVLSKWDEQTYRTGTYVAAGTMLAAVFAAEVFIEFSYNDLFKGVNEYNKSMFGEKHSGIYGPMTITLNCKFQ